MYSKQEAAQLKQEFWTAFGLYMSPVLSAEGEKINWVNYKTGEKSINFRLQADIKRALVAVELTHKDEGIQQIFFEQFEQFKKIFNKEVGENWIWQLHGTDEHGKTVSRIFHQIEGVSIFKREDWPILISFFKKAIIALDQFWSNVKYSFESLR